MLKLRMAAMTIWVPHDGLPWGQAYPKNIKKSYHGGPPGLKYSFTEAFLDTRLDTSVPAGSSFGYSPFHSIYKVFNRMCLDRTRS